MAVLGHHISERKDMNKNNASVIGHPLGGTPTKYNFLWGLLGVFE